MADIVPFGKYKNQPLEVLAQDKSYCDWLVSQGWVAERFPAIHTLIINHFGEPTETPEHNALQLRFLEDDVRTKVSMCAALFRRPFATMFHPERYFPFFAQIGPPSFEHGGIDAAWFFALWTPDRDALWAKGFEEDFGKRPSDDGSRLWEALPFDCLVECKPTLGDDYPAVLRFMHSLDRPGVKVVVVQDYTFRGGTIEQVQRLFLASNVLLLNLADVLALPEVPFFSKEDLPDAVFHARAHR